MQKPSFRIEPEKPSDANSLSDLCAQAFGPGRFTRTAYRIREGKPPVAGLSLVARAGDVVAGSIRFTDVRIGKEGGALLLGPLVISPEFAGQGCGRTLIARGLEAAREAGYRLVVLVGDLPYYERAGFQRVPRGQIVFPGPVDPDRILAAELAPGCLQDFSGELTAN